MFVRKTFGRNLALIAATFILAVAMPAQSKNPAGLDSDGDLFRGHISAHLVTGPECTSPVGMCTKGRISGDIRGTFVFTVTTLTPTADTPVTGVVNYTGDVLIHTRRGDIFVKDSGGINNAPGSTGDVGSVSTITG